jgi:hypothetical protein
MRGEFPAMRFSPALLLFSRPDTGPKSRTISRLRSWGREFKSLLLHHPVSKFSDISENPSKSARVRAICDCGMDAENALGGPNPQSLQNLSGRDLARSMDHRRKFAF